MNNHSEYNEAVEQSTKLNVVGKVVAISISRKKGIPKSNISSAKLIENHGIDGDAHKLAQASKLFSNRKY